MPRLRRAFFARPCLEVARDLVGCVLVHVRPGGLRLAGRLVEVEAYLGEGRDPASHAHRGQSPRNRSMFGPPGHLYVYRSYGIHSCVNLVCEPAGRGAAVLLRALEPIEGLAQMRGLRGLNRDGGVEPAVASGPGRLAEALDLGLECDGASAVGPDLYLLAPATGSQRDAVACGPRVGISRGLELPYRFHAEGSPFVTRWRPVRAARQGAAVPART